MSESSVQAAHPLTSDELLQLLAQLQQRSALAEAGILVACLAVSWLLLRLMRSGRGHATSVWFGLHVVDGVLFPVLALCLALAARRAFMGVLPLTVFRLIIPVLASLAVIRLTVKVLGVAFPKSPAVRVIERTVSWLAWIVAVLWVTGVMPMLLAEMEASPGKSAPRR